MSAFRFVTVLACVAAATAIAAPQITCEVELKDKCTKYKSEYKSCLDCAEKEGKMAGCTMAEEEAFCKPPPVNERCMNDLQFLCGKERHNKTQCIRCVDENNSTLHKANCTTKMVDEFCTVEPPKPEDCPAVYEKVCGADRHNKTICDTCIKDHAKEIEEMKCTLENGYKFCEGPPKPPPSYDCDGVLKKYCEHDVKNRTTCLHCAKIHANETRAAHCTVEQIDKFCEVKPTPPPPNHCRSEIESLCGAAKKEGEKMCFECEEKNEERLKMAGCTDTELKEFCGYVPPIPETCTREFFKDCGMERHNVTACDRCAEEHIAALEKANCTRSDLVHLCEPPTPPNASCYQTLHTKCEKVALNKTECIDCAREYESKDHCTREEVERFCHITPTPDQSCYKALYEDCERDRMNQTKCVKCAREVGMKFNCTTKDEDEFCHVHPPVPNGTCTHEFEETCGADRHNRTLCDKCVKRHNETYHKLHCSMDEAYKFCEVSPHPTPSGECERVMGEYCSADMHKGKVCTECLTKHHNQTRAAKCTYAQETEFCKESDLVKFFNMIASLF